MPRKATYQDRNYPVRYLADIGSGQFHDLHNATLRCNIVEIIDKHQDRAYEFKVDAKKDGYSPCPYCMPDEAKLSGL